jgi:hypothetical protein
MNKFRTAATALLLGAVATPSIGAARATDNGPTCSDLEFLEIEVHGQHVVRDYVAGLEHHELSWPPRGGVIGRTVSARGGAALPGGPGAGGHLPAGIAPGASFCTDSNSPGIRF